MHSEPTPDPPRAAWPWWFIALICLFLIVIAGFLLAPHQRPEPGSGNTAGTTTAGSNASATSATATDRANRVRSGAGTGPTLSAEEIVTSKVASFGRTRREIVRRIARRSNQEVPPEIEKFFDAVESGRWEEIKASWDSLSSRSGQYEGSKHSPELDPYWPAVLDAYGVAEQAHLWPAQKLLDYGHAVLDSLRPGMVYVGGTDNGRWVPELLNENGEGEEHIIVTQNAFADARYVEYMKELYGDRLSTLTADDSQRAFQAYLQDAQKRLEHDQQFPDEPKQIRPGEEVKVVDGRVQVSGQVAVMAINERMLEMLMDKNPGVSFAIQESFPLRGTYADALPLGPLMELRAQDGASAFTSERAGQTLDYWRGTAQQILGDPEAIGSEAALKSYSHDACSAANLLAAHNFNSEAEETYRLGRQLWPDSPEAVFDLANLLARTGREAEAKQMVDDFNRKHPEQAKDNKRWGW